MAWITVRADRVLYLDQGLAPILCDRDHPGSTTLVLLIDDVMRAELQTELEDEMEQDHTIKVEQERKFASGILSVTTTFRLMVTGDAGLKELDRLIRILTVQKQILEEDECSPATTSPDTSQTTTAPVTGEATATTAQMSAAVPMAVSESGGVGETANTGIPPTIKPETN